MIGRAERAWTRADPERIAVIDLGSSSFRLVVVEAGASGEIRPLLRKKVPLNLGLIVGRVGRIPEPYATAAVETLSRLRRQAHRSGASYIITVATSALRDAGNREDLAHRLAAAAGEPVRFLTGEEEAALTFSALRAAHCVESEVFLGVDLGGGSLEIAVGDDERLHFTASLELGSSRLTGRFLPHDPPTSSERLLLRRHVEDELRAVAPEVARRHPTRCIVAGGTVKALARLIVAERGDGAPESMDGLVLDGEDLAAVGERLLAATHAERLRMPGMSLPRAGVLGAGAVVLTTLADVLGLASFSLCEWGLREGIVLEALGLEGSLAV